MSITYRVDNSTGIIEFDRPDSKVNILDMETIHKLDSYLNEIAKNSNLTALLLMSKKSNIFIAGADIKEIEGITDPSDGEAKSRAGQEILNKLEDLPIPSIAVIDGAALGGGCELAIACTYRVATFNEKVRIGLPEVQLGIIPGFAGTYRLPRLIGLIEALKIILPGGSVDHKKALRIGLVDRLYPQAGLDNSLREFIEEVKGSNKRKSYFKKKVKGIKAFQENSPIGRALVFAKSRQNVLKKSKKFYPAPLAAIKVIKKTINMKRRQALDIEAKEFSQLAITDVSKNLVSLYYLRDKYSKLMPEECAKLTPAPIKKCGVIGAGIMGGGIAQILSYKDIRARMKDINHEALAQGLQSANKVFQKGVKRRKLSKAQAQAKMAQISGTIDYSGFENVDCVIEAVVENMKIKKQVFRELSEVVDREAVLCTNTSALSVTEIAKVTKNPERVIGFHFFNPVHLMPLIEIITTELTSAQTAATALSLAKRLNKVPIIVKDAPGFLVNRILLGYINEAGHLLEEGVSVDFIDQVMLKFGMPMGPLTLSDEVGLDVGVKVLHILHEGLGERFKPAGIFEKVFEKGLLGKKSKRGFYIHNKHKNLNPEIRKLQTRRVDEKFALMEEYEKRMVLVMVNEAARCLEDGIIDEPSTVDAGMVFGTGFPPFLGGLLRYADKLGTTNVVESLTRLAEEHQAERFRPCAYLLDLSKNQKTFY